MNTLTRKSLASLAWVQTWWPNAEKRGAPPRRRIGPRPESAGEPGRAGNDPATARRTSARIDLHRLGYPRQRRRAPHDRRRARAPTAGGILRRRARPATVRRDHRLPGLAARGNPPGGNLGIW